MQGPVELRGYCAALTACGVREEAIHAALARGASSAAELSAALLLAGAAVPEQLEQAYARWGAAAVEPPAAGVLGPYEVEARLGQGACGEVYRVRDPRTGARYAVKRLLDLGDVEERARFAREAEVLARLRHPHVVQVHAAELGGGAPYFVLDLCPGGSLGDRLRKGPLPGPEARGLLLALSRGLEAAHAAGVLHRDLKPDNVLFGEDGLPKLSDFGLGRVLSERHSRLTQTGVVLGTPHYMAPEQVLDGKRADERSDVYGLGAVLYHCLTGQAPFASRGSLLATLGAVLREPLTPPRALAPDVDPGLEAVCLRALEKDPDRRYASARALGEALAGGAPPARRGVRLWLGLGLALVAAATAIALSVRATDEPRGEPPPPARHPDEGGVEDAPPAAIAAPDRAAVFARAREHLAQDDLTAAWRALGEVSWLPSRGTPVEELLERTAADARGAFDPSLGEAGSRGSAWDLAWECAVLREELLDSWSIRDAERGAALVERAWRKLRQAVLREDVVAVPAVELRALELVDSISAALDRMSQGQRNELWDRVEPLPTPAGGRAWQWALFRAAFGALQDFDRQSARRSGQGGVGSGESYALWRQAWVPVVDSLWQRPSSELSGLPLNVRLDLASGLAQQGLERPGSLERCERLLEPYPGSFSGLDASRWDQVARVVLELVLSRSPESAPPVEVGLRIAERGLERASSHALFRVHEVSLDLRVCAAQPVAVEGGRSPHVWMAQAAAALHRCRSDPAPERFEEAGELLRFVELRLGVRVKQPEVVYPLQVARYHAALLAGDPAAPGLREQLRRPPGLRPCSWIPWYTHFDPARHRFACEPDDGKALIWQPEPPPAAR